MKKNKNLKFYSLDEIIKQESRSKKFRRVYEEELARLKLVGQIRRARQASRLTQKVVAARAHMPQSVIARIEGGQHNLSVETLQRVARVIGKEVQLV